MLERLRAGLAKTRHQLAAALQGVVGRRLCVDEEMFGELEEALVRADVGVGTAGSLVREVKARCAQERVSDPSQVLPLLQGEIQARLCRGSGRLQLAARPTVIMIVGVNGSGKTTTVGKLAHRFRQEGKRVLVGAADTFRAAAIDQLEVWARRAGADLVKHAEGGDPAAVAFDAVNAAVARKVDVVLLDTAGRMHTRADLMQELAKVRRVVGKALPGAPHEVLLVLDATTGQNALRQAEEFRAATALTGIVLTKLDGTARGGVVVAIADQLGLPVKLVGVGEGLDDLRDFDPEAFASALFES
ncbi:MAG: signal recognition particle-docking protein FtsY [Bacillota bacterium]